MARRSRVQMMEETRAKLIGAARKAFAEKGFAGASMDDLTADVGLTRGALYHNFGDKLGLLAAVVHQIDVEMAGRAQAAGLMAANAWDGLLAEGVAYIQMALESEVQRIVLLDGRPSWATRRAGRARICVCNRPFRRCGASSRMASCGRSMRRPLRA